ncbi:MAG: hypothetical protein GX616_24880 [Planctomycetes bacterium]|nr:hypothetical protein [Planctomycetota bacterium]
MAAVRIVDKPKDQKKQSKTDRLKSEVQGEKDRRAGNAREMAVKELGRLIGNGTNAFNVDAIASAVGLNPGDFANYDDARKAALNLLEQRYVSTGTTSEDGRGQFGMIQPVMSNDEMRAKQDAVYFQEQQLPALLEQLGLENIGQVSPEVLQHYTALYERFDDATRPDWMKVKPGDLDMARSEYLFENPTTNMLSEQDMGGYLSALQQHFGVDGYSDKFLASYAAARSAWLNNVGGDETKLPDHLRLDPNLLPAMMGGYKEDDTVAKPNQGVLPGWSGNGGRATGRPWPKPPSQLMPGKPDDGGIPFEGGTSLKPPAGQVPSQPPGDQYPFNPIVNPNSIISGGLYEEGQPPPQRPPWIPDDIVDPLDPNPPGDMDPDPNRMKFQENDFNEWVDTLPVNRGLPEHNGIPIYAPNRPRNPNDGNLDSRRRTPRPWPGNGHSLL